MLVCKSMVPVAEAPVAAVPRSPWAISAWELFKYAKVKVSMPFPPMLLFPVLRVMLPRPSGPRK